MANLKLDARPGSVQECETDENQHVTSVSEKKNPARVWGGHRSVTYRRLRLFLCHFKMSTCINGGVSFSYHHYCSCVSRPPSLWPVNFIQLLVKLRQTVTLIFSIAWLLCHFTAAKYFTIPRPFKKKNLGGDTVGIVFSTGKQTDTDGQEH